VLSYLGIIRYYNILYTKSNKYIENYINVPHIENTKIIIISKLKTYSNIDIKPFINSLFDQTIHVDNIIIYNNDNRLDHLDNNIISVMKYNDNSKYSHIDNIMNFEKEKYTIIIDLQENIIYGKDFIENIVDKFNSDKKVLIDKDKRFILFTPELINIDNMNKNKDIKQYVTEYITTDYFKNYKY
jgi:hypothetical protein